MLKHVQSDCTVQLDGVAHIVISVCKDGRTILRSFVGDKWDAIYAPIPDERLTQIEIPKLLTELRAQMELAAAGV